MSVGAVFLRSSSMFVNHFICLEGREQNFDTIRLYKVTRMPLLIYNFLISTNSFPEPKLNNLLSTTILTLLF